MLNLTRADNTVLGRWWWTVDRWTLGLLAVLIGFGLVLIQAATPAIANARGLGGFYYVERHIVQLVPAIAIIIGVSLLNPRQIRHLAFLLFPIFLIMVMLTFFIGAEVKGATRWLQLPGGTMQPSEFLKPTFAIITAWLMARHCEKRGFPALSVSIAILFVCMILLLLQPDLGMTALLCVVWGGQFLIAGLPLLMVGLLLALGIGGIVAAYFTLPHVTYRIDRFLDKQSGDTYQVDQAMEAFANGGLLGTGPGEGTVKMALPDAHTDFIFPVAGEELGLLWCLVIVMVFAMIVLRGFWRLQKENNIFVILAAGGLLIQFGFQAFVNMASTLQMIPPKGMTLPFISYGGSSLWALALGMGFLLALTRKRYGQGDT